MIEKKIIDVNEIREILPHRYPFLLVDKILDFEKNVGGIGVKNFTINEEFFQGHFPNFPVVPGVIITECMAQSAAIVAIKSLDKPEEQKKGVLFASIEYARFRKPVVPGDVFKVKIKLLKNKMNIMFAETEGFVDDVKVNECKFSAMIYDIK